MFVVLESQWIDFGFYKVTEVLRVFYKPIVCYVRKLIENYRSLYTIGIL